MRTQYIGIDLHKASFQSCCLAEDGTRVWEARFVHSAAGIAAWGARVAAEAQVAVEALGPTWTFVDAIAPYVARVCVVDPRKTRLKAGYAAKTDRLDARRLADALRRDSVVGVYVPPPAIRELRELCRGRHQLVRTRTRLVNAVRALLLRHGVGDPPAARLTTRRGQQWLATVQVPGQTQEVLARLVRLVAATHAEAVAADAAVRARATQDPIASALQALAGVGPVLALTLRAEIGTITRFASPGALASYAGVVPRVEASAGRVRFGRITRTGSPWLRWALVAAAVKNLSREDGVGRWARRLLVRKGVHTARVALARALCTDICRRWPATDGASPRDADRSISLTQASHPGVVI
jgi:transposase